MNKQHVNNSEQHGIDRMINEGGMGFLFYYPDMEKLDLLASNDYLKKEGDRNES